MGELGEEGGIGRKQGGRMEQDSEEYITQYQSKHVSDISRCLREKALTSREQGIV